MDKKLLADLYGLVHRWEETSFPRSPSGISLSERNAYVECFKDAAIELLNVLNGFAAREATKLELDAMIQDTETETRCEKAEDQPESAEHSA